MKKQKVALKNYIVKDPNGDTIGRFRLPDLREEYKEGIKNYVHLAWPEIGDDYTIEEVL